MGAERHHLREMSAELHEALLRDLFRAHVLSTIAGDARNPDWNLVCIEVIFSAGKISNERRLEIEIGVLATMRVLSPYA
ncbi:hypothetical protein FJY94_00270 [Candidatus Kaiserbacteria bacterium]|nr:hypothetical protein [Candidatus Kaiserbacteria bacterium]